MSRYRGVAGIARQVPKRHRGVDGVARSITKSYRGVDGVARQFFSSGVPVGELAVGESVYIDVDGVSKEFLVVHQGNPDTAMYDASCNGTWLLMKDAYLSMVWNSTSSHDYRFSSLHYYLRDTFPTLLSPSIQSAIKSVKIPYYKGTTTNGTTEVGSNGLAVKIFALSEGELGNGTYDGVLGAKLSYFQDKTKRIAYHNGSTVWWWTRNPYYSAINRCYCVMDTGEIGSVTVNSKYYARPAFILDSNTLVDPQTHKIIG